MSAKIVNAQSAKGKTKIASAQQLFESNAENAPTDDTAHSDVGFKVFKLAPSNFKIWDNQFETKAEVIQAKLFNHIEHISKNAAQEVILYELLLKSGFALTTPIAIIICGGQNVFSIEGGTMLICLEKQITLECLKAMAVLQPSRVICLDEAFTGENADAIKTNAVQIMKSKGIENFKTV